MRNGVIVGVPSGFKSPFALGNAPRGRQLAPIGAAPEPGRWVAMQLALSAAHLFAQKEAAWAGCAGGEPQARAACENAAPGAPSPMPLRRIGKTRRALASLHQAVQLSRMAPLSQFSRL